MPHLSVVIPTRDRLDALRRTVESLARQELVGIEAELIVVDNGSSDGTPEWLASATAGPLELRALSQPRPGPAAARNLGVAEARSDLVMFMGDDTRPADAGLLAGHVREQRSATAPTAIVGRALWDPTRPVTRVMEWLMSSGKQFDYGRAEREPPGPWLFYTSNVSLPRSAIVEADGFDERFPSAAWEDFELALRMTDRGLEIAYRPELVVHHDHLIDLRASLRRMESVGRGARLLNELHPDRRPLPAPSPGGLRGDLGRLVAPVAMRVPDLGSERWYRAAHFAALARGHARGGGLSEGSRGGLALERPAERASASVVVPFHGTATEARELLARLAPLRMREGDELVVVDNTRGGVVPESARARVVHAPEEQGSYFARNRGAEQASGDWLVFVDADCSPAPDLLDELLREPVPAGVGALAGAVLPARGDGGLVERYARSRAHLSQAAPLASARPFAVTACLAVRRSAFERVGGFRRGIRSGGDADFCWRLQDAGWRLAYRERAAVEHSHRQTVRDLARTHARYAAGRAWLARAHGAHTRPRVVLPLARALAGAIAWALVGRGERARFKALDGVVTLAEAVGYALPNRSRRAATARPPAEAAGRTPLVVLADHFPVLSETFVDGEVRALAKLGHPVRVEAAARHSGRSTAHVDYGEDDGVAERLAALAWLCARHPLRCARDLAARLRWRREEHVRPLNAIAPAARRLVRGGERHLHAHFAAGAALDALRLARLTGRTWSVVAHAYDVFQQPRNLREKLDCADLVVTVCEYNARHLRTLTSNPVEIVVMGVEPERFTRSAPYPGGRRVLAVGRLVEKKGFRHLIDAAALLEEREPLEAVEIVGDGPLRVELEALVERLGLGGRVVLHGSRGHDFVRERLEAADLLAMPCVVAADGDRDSMPVVVKEALAMEVPVVGSDEVALPEMIEPGWGRLAPPGDAGALASAIAELLALPAEERAAMGARGRAFVSETCNLERETAKLSELVSRVADA